MDEPTVVSLFTWLTCVVWSAYIVIMVWERHLFLAFCTFFLLGLFVYFAWLILYYLFIYTDLRLILPVLAANALTSFDFNPCQPAPLPVGMIPGVDLVQLRCILDSLSKAPIPSRRTDLFVKATPSFGSRCLAAACLLGGPQPNRDVTVATWYQAPRFESFQCCRNSFGFLFSNKIPNEACPVGSWVRHSRRRNPASRDKLAGRLTDWASNNRPGHVHRRHIIPEGDFNADRV